MAEKISKELYRKAAKGTRDMLPAQMALKEQALSMIKGVFKRHGAVEIDTPVFERREVLTGKYGGEASKLVYDLADQRGELLSLRYDLTVPFARFMATHNFTKLKRFHIGKVYRRDQPSQQGGRYREFYQCDFDIAGPSEKMVADAEVLKVFSELLDGLKIDFKLKLNDRRLLEMAISKRAGCCQPGQFESICTSIDKLDKEPWAKVSEELVQKGLNREQIEKIEEFIALSGEDFDRVYSQLKRMCCDEQEALHEMNLLREYTKAMEIHDKIVFDTSLARGLDYYTGMIFEAVLSGEDKKYGLGSIAAGGRYDNLIGMFSKQQIPSAGGSLGIERIFNILEARAQLENQIFNPIDVMIGKVGTVNKAEILKVASWLWNSGLKTELFYEDVKKVSDQIKQAASRDAKYLIIVGEDELAQGKIVIRDLKQKSQETIAFDKDIVIQKCQIL